MYEGKATFHKNIVNERNTVKCGTEYDILSSSYGICKMQNLRIETSLNMTTK